MEKEVKFDVELANSVCTDYSKTGSIREAARLNDISDKVARKLLITAEVYSTEGIERVIRLRNDGKSAEEIAELTGLSVSAVNQNLPYEKGNYNFSPSVNALRIRKSRSKQ